MAAKPDEPIYETISDYNSIDELIGKSDEKSANVIKDLKNQIQAKDIRISELETENELLKNEQIKPKTRVDPISSKIETYILVMINCSLMELKVFLWKKSSDWFL